MLVITRHRALIEYAIEIGVLKGDEEVIPHATPDQFKGKDVFGILPLDLAHLANSVTTIPLAIPKDWRGRELTLAEVRSIAKEPATFIVEKCCSAEDAEYYTNEARSWLSHGRLNRALDALREIDLCPPHWGVQKALDTALANGTMADTYDAVSELEEVLKQ